MTEALTAIGLSQNTDLLFRRVSFALHGLGPFSWLRLTSQGGSKFRSQVTRAGCGDWFGAFLISRAHQSVNNEIVQNKPDDNQRNRRRNLRKSTNPGLRFLDGLFAMWASGRIL